MLAVVFYPLHRRILERTAKPSLAAAASTLLVVLLILLPVTGITVAVVRELSGVATTFQASDHTWANSVPPGVKSLLDRIRPYVDVDIDAEYARKFIAERMQTWGSALAASTLVVVGSAVGAFTQMILVVFTLFYFFRDGDRIRHAVYEIVPLQRVQWQDIISRTQEVIAATVYGVLAIAAIQGTLGTFIFCGARPAVAAALGRVDVLPLDDPDGRRVSRVGAGRGATWRSPARTSRPIILVVWGVLVIGGIDNILSPRLVGRRASCTSC